jgi:hypothetical protein
MLGGWARKNFIASDFFLLCEGSIAQKSILSISEGD